MHQTWENEELSNGLIAFIAVIIILGCCALIWFLWFLRQKRKGKHGFSQIEEPSRTIASGNDVGTIPPVVHNIRYFQICLYFFCEFESTHV